MTGIKERLQVLRRRLGIDELATISHRPFVYYDLIIVMVAGDTGHKALGPVSRHEIRA